MRNLIMFLAVGLASLAANAQAVEANVNAQVIPNLIATKTATVRIGQSQIQIFVDEVRILKTNRSFVFMNLHTKNPFAYLTDTSPLSFCAALGFGHGDGDISSQKSLGSIFNRPTMMSVDGDTVKLGEWATYLSPNIGCYLTRADAPVDNNGQ
jgi:hypothetical protein